MPEPDPSFGVFEFTPTVRLLLSREPGTDLIDKRADRSTLGPPLFTTDNLEKAERFARARVMEFPTSEILIVSAAGSLSNKIRNEEFKKAIGKGVIELGRIYKRYAMTIGLLVICTICLAAASLGAFGIWPVIIFACIGLLYWVIVRIKIQNEIEGAVICVVMLAIAFATVSAISAVDRARARQPSHPVPTSKP